MSFLERKNIKPSFHTYFIDAMGAMALGLFASLLIGTIFGTIYDKTGIEFFATMKQYATSATGPAIAALVAAECGKIVSKETKIDILVTPTVTIAIGTALAVLTGPWISEVMASVGSFIIRCTELQPLWMGVLVSVVVGICLTLPISSAAICASLGLVGLGGGAATAGCCAQMIGFAVMSYKENKFAGLIAQGLGTSMLQMGNIIKNPRIWIPPTLTSAITGPIATCVFKMQNPVAVASGMGTCGLVGPIGVMTMENFDRFDLVGMLTVCIILPAILTPIFAKICRKLGWIKPGDLKLKL